MRSCSHWGHHIGDELLCAVAERISACFDGGQRLYRIGGDEFVVLSRISLSHKSSKRIAQEIVSCFSDAFDVGGTQVVAGGSVGITRLRSDDEDEVAVLSRADLALYEAKSNFGNCLVEFREDMASEAMQRMHMDKELRRALDNDEFFLEFQPIIGMETSNVRGFEALVRWNHPCLLYTSPSPRDA